LSVPWYRIILLNRKKATPMTEYTCMKCNENIVDILELYCSHCSLEMLAESMIDYDLIDQLFLAKEAN
jgi:hypothetical protein